jgi:hypothetical protein
MSEREIKGWVENIIRDFIQNSPENSLKDATGEKAWEDCLIGFSNGADSIFDEYKEHVGSFHMTPLELFTIKPNATIVRRPVIRQNGGPEPESLGSRPMWPYAITWWQPCRRKGTRR